MYHKEYSHEKGDAYKHPTDPKEYGHEAFLKKHSKLVKSEAEHKSLGADWGDHPSAKGSKSEEKHEAKAQEPGDVVFEDLDEKEEAPKHSKWSKK